MVVSLGSSVYWPGGEQDGLNVHGGVTAYSLTKMWLKGIAKTECVEIRKRLHCLLSFKTELGSTSVAEPCCLYTFRGALRIADILFHPSPESHGFLPNCSARGHHSPVGFEAQQGLAFFQQQITSPPVQRKGEVPLPLAVSQDLEPQDQTQLSLPTALLICSSTPRDRGTRWPCLACQLLTTPAFPSLH